MNYAVFLLFVSGCVFAADTPCPGAYVPDALLSRLVDFKHESKGGDIVAVKTNQGKWMYATFSQVCNLGEFTYIAVLNANKGTLYTADEVKSIEVFKEQEKKAGQ